MSDERDELLKEIGDALCIQPSPSFAAGVRARIASADAPRGWTAWLAWAGELLKWSPGGYTDRRPRPAGGRVSVLTPASTVRVLAAGYVPGVHPTARTIPA